MCAAGTFELADLDINTMQKYTDGMLTYFSPDKSKQCQETKHKQIQGTFSAV